MKEQTNMSDKLKGEARRHQEMQGAINTAGPKSWARPKMGEVKSLNQYNEVYKPGKAGSESGSPGGYIPTGPEVDGDLTGSSPFKTHRGVLEGGDRRGDTKPAKTTGNKLKGNDYARR
jgi:hypothetical protein